MGWCHAGRLGMGIAPEFHMMGLLLSE